MDMRRYGLICIVILIILMVVLFIFLDTDLNERNMIPIMFLMLGGLAALFMMNQHIE